MARFDLLKGLFGLLPTPYTEDLEIHTQDLRAVADFCCKSGQHGIVWAGLGQGVHEEVVCGTVALVSEGRCRRPLRGQAQPQLEQQDAGAHGQFGGEAVVVGSGHGSRSSQTVARSIGSRTRGTAATGAL